MVRQTAVNSEQAVQDIERDLKGPAHSISDREAEDKYGQIASYNRSIDGRGSLLLAQAQSTRKSRVDPLDSLDRLRPLDGTAEHAGLKARHSLRNQQVLRLDLNH
jgi:hypothetical protein